MSGLVTVELLKDHGYHSKGTVRTYDHISADRLIEAGVAKVAKEPEAAPIPNATRVKASDVAKVLGEEK